ncbi:MAG TPA: SUMF1/EgtB/PvdO family nonheme iron enzyme [Thermoanaerobaculia bacterium]|nr:SUMF1/EgtB/PvdO family nonheme iron enzyme [Thermoanaerobaculia bacterium]
MPAIARLVLVELVGDAPPALHLAPLATIASSIATVREALTPYLAPAATVDHVRDLAAFDALAPQDGITAIYAVGHGWRAADGRYTVAVRATGAGETRLLDGDALLAAIARVVAREQRAVCFVDTCAAAALAATLPGAVGDRCTFVFASAADESALEYPLDRATRFALALRDALAREPADIDAVALALDLRRRLIAPGLLPPQQVSYWSLGSPLVLTRAGRSGTAAGAWKTHRVLRAALLTGGALAAIAVIAAAAYYRTHERIRITLGDLATIASDVQIEVARLEPATNQRVPLERFHAGASTQFRVLEPAADLLVVISARYTDGAPRALHFHLHHQPGWAWRAKNTDLRLPPAEEILRHPTMAYIPAGPWLKDETRTLTVNRQPYWIDIAPVTVQRYLPVALRAAASGAIERDRSVLLHDIQNAAGVEATGMTQLPKLLGDLGAVFSVIDAAERPIARTTPAEEAAALLPRVHVACPTCPAPMSLDEARAYCAGRGMRLPTRAQWELAARGTDGRRFPWGDRWNDAYGNAGFPPDVGKPMTLRPSGEFVGGASPYGVIDLVGNAGDWIEPEGAYEHTFMGGLYRYNRDDCTVFSTSPDTGEIWPRYEVTCRCVSR